VEDAGVVREISVRCQVSGKALAAGIAANLVDQEPAASAVPLTYFSNDAYSDPLRAFCATVRSRPARCVSK
jgi:hypothetical protein